jgi:AcrR family transcriptional regulator
MLDVDTTLPRKEREFLRHRREILMAAEEVFSEKGYISATMEEIAQRAEFAVGTLYKFFENKGSLYSEVILMRMSELEEESYGALEDAEGPHGKIRSCFRSRIDQFWKNPSFFRFFYHGPVGAISETNTGFLPEIRERYERYLDRLRDIFAEGIQNGEFRPLGKDLMALSFEGLLQAYLERLSGQESPERSQEEEDGLLSIFLDGISA